LEDLGIDGENIKMERKEMGWGPCAGLMCFRIGTGGRIFECGNKSSSSIKCGGFLDLLRNRQLIRKGSTSWR